MSNTRETVGALVSAFNVNNYDFNAVKTNFKLQSRGGEDCIVVSFDEGMNRYQCQEYLDSIKRKIIREFYGIEESNNKEILDTAKLIFDVNSFPFNMKGKWSQNEQGRIEFLAPIDKGVIFNLKSHLAASLKKDVLEDMLTCSIFTNAFDKKKYMWCGEFPNEQLRKQFEHEFLLRMSKRYDNVPNDPLKVKGNSVYIKDVFNDARFIDSVTRRAVWLIGRDLQASSKSRSDVKAFKDLIIEFINQSIGLTVAGFVCDFPLGKEEATVFIPVVLDNREPRVLASKEALKLNHAFNGAVFNDLYGGTQGELAINGGNGLYSIDFSNPEISHCVITKIIESSVINAKHELSIDPELRFRASTPVPNGPNSDLTRTSIQGFPTRSESEALKESARQGSGTEKGLLGLHNYVSLAVAGPSSAPSAGPSLCPQSGPSSSRGANESMQIGKSTWYDMSSSDVEDVNDVEHEKQQVSDGCSEAKSQKSKSLKKRLGALVRSLSGNFERTGAINRNGVGRDTTRSTPETPVTEKPPVSKRSFSFPTRIKAKSNPPSGATSPTHEGAPGGLKPLTSDERKELRPFLCPNLKKKLDSNSLEGEQFKYLLYTPGGKREIKNSFENPEENLRRSVKAQLPGDRSSQASADSGLGKSLERGQSPSLIEKFSDKLPINSRVDSPDIKKHLQKEKEGFV